MACSSTLPRFPSGFEVDCPASTLTRVANTRYPTGPHAVCSCLFRLAPKVRSTAPSRHRPGITDQGVYGVVGCRDAAARVRMYATAQVSCCVRRPASGVWRLAYLTLVHPFSYNRSRRWGGDCTLCAVQGLRHLQVARTRCPECHPGTMYLCLSQLRNPVIS